MRTLKLNGGPLFAGIGLAVLLTVAVVAVLIFRAGGGRNAAHSSFLSQSIQPADSLFNAGNYSDALAEYQSALTAPESKSDPGRAAYLNWRIGRTLLYLQRYEEAKPILTQSYNTYTRLHDLHGLSQVLRSLSYAYDHLGEHDQAKKLAGECIALCDKTGDQDLKCLALNNLGTYYGQMEQYEQAAKYFSQALELRKTAVNDNNKLQLLENLARCRHELGNNEESLKWFNEALELCSKIGDHHLYLDALERIPPVYESLNQHQQQIETLQKARDVCRDLGDVSSEIRVISNLVSAYSDSGLFSEANKCAQEGLSLCRESGAASQECNMLVDIGNLYSSYSSPALGLEYYQQALALSEETHNRRGTGRALSSMATMYYWMKDLDKAREYYEKDLAVRRELNDSAGIGAGLSSLISIDRELGKYEEGLSYARESLNIFRATGYNLQTCELLWNTGDIYKDLKDQTKAEEYYEQALKLSRKLHSPSRESWALFCIAELQYDVGDYTEAIRYVRKSLKAAELSEFPDDFRKYLLQLAGWCYMRQGDFQEAASNFKQAIAIVETVRGGIKHESLKISYVEQVAAMYDGIVLSLIELGRTDEAFDYVEKARARAFLDMLAGGAHVTSTNSPESASPTYSTSSSSQIPPQQYELLSSEVATPLNIQQVQNFLTSGTTLLEYYQTDDALLVWAIRHDKIQFHKLDAGRSEIAGLVQEFRESLRTLGNQDALLSALYEKLLTASLDSASGEHLIVVPHGALHYLPFQALRDADGDYLIDRCSITYLPSASVLKYLGPKEHKFKIKLLAMGNPATDKQGYQPLKCAEGEVSAIGKLFPGSVVRIGIDATEAEFRNIAGQYDLLHLACHSELNEAYPMFSGLLLAPGGDQDGELDVHEVFTLDLNAYLVVLSGCETGLGKLTSGDDLVGLSRAFIYAGTPALAASLWQVADESTGYLMAEFYGHLKTLGRAEALRQAQIKTRAKYPHPFYWAPFVLIGEGN